MCEASGFCSFPDASCASGRRYGQHAGAGLVDECVVPSGGSSSTTTGMPTSGSSTSGLAESGSSEDSSGAAAESSTGDLPPEPLQACEPLGPAQGVVLEAGPDDVASLPDMIAAAEAGTTIVLAPGTYDLGGTLYLGEPGLVLRSSTGNPDDVVLDGTAVEQAVVAMAASNQTVAELTIRGSGTHQIHVTSGVAGSPITGPRIHRVHFIDPQLSAVRANYDAVTVDEGEVSCSHIEVTQERRAAMDCNTASGIRGYSTAGWTVRDNRIDGLWCETGLAPPAIGFQESAYDTAVLRNTIRNCTIGIRFGLEEDGMDVRDIPDPGCTDGYYGHHRGVVRNNMIAATDAAMATSEYGFFSGVLMWQVCETEVSHNTVFSSIGETSSIEYRFDRTIAAFYNNLVSGELRVRDDAAAPVLGNVESVAASVFVSPLEGDLHLVAGASVIDQGANLGPASAEVDIDGDPREGPVDVGADEFVGR